ncbi:MAG: COX15/CtaA family protein [Zoogloeaceae bacterium]|nr:COX15/CtaA family protein [Zoogloeaceae bacterium]
MYRKLVLAAFALTAFVVVLGAYVRLSDAGLGCPDWPGCYGQLTPHHAADDIARAQEAMPGGPVSLPKAWKEMVHRYLAASLGLLILAIAALAWRRRADPTVAWQVAVALVGVVIFQGLLGKWTVTLLLKPAIVTGHLLGGMTTLALLGWLALRAWSIPRLEVGASLALSLRLGLVLVAVQIILGGWTSTNYAALACADFPTCHGDWWPEADYRNAFHVVRELGMTAEGELLSQEALTAIHWTHRLGALVVAAYLSVLAFRLARQPGAGKWAALLMAGWTIQALLGVANVLFSLPLPLAVAHNGGAALLLVILVTLNYRFGRVSAPAWTGRNHENAYA